MKYRLLCQQFEIDWIGVRKDIKVAFAQDSILEFKEDEKRILVTVNEEWTPSRTKGILAVYKNAYIPFYYKDKRIDLI